eukprot:gene5941-9771_t
MKKLIFKKTIRINIKKYHQTLKKYEKEIKNKKNFLHNEDGYLVHSKKYKVSNENGNLLIGSRGVDIEIIGEKNPNLQEEITFEAFAYNCNENKLDSHPIDYWNEFKFEEFYRPLTNQFRFFMHRTPLPSLITRIINKAGRDSEGYFLDQLYNPKFILLRFTVPMNFSIDLESDFSDIGINNINGKKISISTQSGYIAIGETETTELNLKTETGNLFLDSIKSSKMNVESQQGNVYINKLKSENVVVKSKGDVIIEHGYKGKYNIMTDGDFKFYMMENGIFLNLLSQQRHTFKVTNVNLFVNPTIHSRLFVFTEREINLESIIYKGLKRDFELNGVIGENQDNQSPKSLVRITGRKTNVEVDSFELVGQENSNILEIPVNQKELQQKNFRNFIGILMVFLNLFYFVWSVNRIHFNITDIIDPSIEEWNEVVKGKK